MSTLQQRNSAVLLEFVSQPEELKDCELGAATLSLRVETLSTETGGAGSPLQYAGRIRGQNAARARELARASLHLGSSSKRGR